MCEAKLDANGRITIPAKVRRALRLHAGDRIRFVESPNGIRIERVKTGSIMDMHGIAKWTGKPVSIEEMNETIAQGWAGLLRFDD